MADKIETVKRKYMVSGTPHIHSDETISSIMLDVVIALCPAMIASIYFFSVKALFLTLASVLSCVLFELLYQKITKQDITISDLSAVVTGMLLAFNLPASAPLWLPVVGAFFAIVIIKQLFGGLGQNFLNPALGARAFLLASYPVQMTDWSISPDGISGATPQTILKQGFQPELVDYIGALFGRVGGCLGETCAIALIIGGIYLIVRKVISWKIPVCYLLTVCILSLLFGRNGAPFYDLLTGGLMLGAFFMATDYSTSPVTSKGKILFAIGCGVLTMIIRTYSKAYPEGVSYSILLMNLAVPLIERFTRPKVFGEVGKNV